MITLGLTSSAGDGDSRQRQGDGLQRARRQSRLLGRLGANHLTDAYSGFFTGGMAKHTMRTDERDMDNFDVDVPALLAGAPTQFPRGGERPFSACLYISGAPKGTPGVHRNT
jgi:hypothetical protein